MSLEENKAIVRRFFDALNANHLETLPTELLDPHYQLYFDSNPPMDRAGAVYFIAAFLTAFPGIHHAIEDQIAEGDRVATRIMVRGKHQAELMGIPATGKSIAIGAMNIHRVVDGRIVEQRVFSDALGMLQQLGVVPAPGQVTA